MGSLASITAFKQELGTSDSSQDLLIIDLLERATGTAERLAGRPLLKVTNAIHYPHDSDPHAESFRLPVAPISAITSIVQLYETGVDDQAFADATPLTPHVDYTWIPETGRVIRLNARWLLRYRHIKVVYTGGYADWLGGAGTPAPPPELRGGVLAEAVRLFNTRKHRGVDSINAGGQGGSVTLADQVAPELLAAVEPYRRCL